MASQFSFCPTALAGCTSVTDDIHTYRGTDHATVTCVAIGRLIILRLLKPLAVYHLILIYLHYFANSTSAETMHCLKSDKRVSKPSINRSTGCQKNKNSIYCASVWYFNMFFNISTKYFRCFQNYSVYNILPYFKFTLKKWTVTGNLQRSMSLNSLCQSTF